MTGRQSRTPARAALHEAMKARDAAKAECRRVEATERATRDLLLSAKDKAAGYADTADRIIKHRAAVVTRAAQQHGKVTDLALPPDLQKRQRDSYTAEQEQEACAAAHDQALAELQYHEKAALAAERVLAEAATRVLVEDHALDTAARLRKAWDDLWRLTDELNALSSCWFPGASGPRAVQIQPDVTRLLQLIAGFDQRQLTGGKNLGAAAAATRWRAYHAALVKNVDAEMPTDDEDNIRVA